MHARRAGTLAVCLLLTAGMVPVHAAAGKLIHLSNGRVVRAESLRQDGTWILATLPGGNLVGIPGQLVTEIEEDLSSGAPDAGVRNIVTSGRYVPPSGASAGRVNERVAAEEDPASDEPPPVPETQPQLQVPDQPTPMGLQVPTPAGLQVPNQADPTRPSGFNRGRARQLRPGG